ncbi:MAG: hypothetical protein EBS72_06905, partial [Rhizobiales bacterium]|nr:hypothetical protein [Hyphomicrobiales bacterium]
MVAAALLGLAVSTAPKAKAANLYFDNDATLAGNNSLTGAGLGGASATWGTASSWYDPNTGTNVTWNNTNNDIAYFYGGTGSGLSVSSPITIGGLVFQTTGYVVGATGNSNTITFGASSNNIILANIAAAGIRGSLAGTGTVTLSGGIFGGQTAGTLTLTLNGTAASQTGYSGATVINNGMTMALAVNSVGLQSTSGITLNNGGITLTNTTAAEALLNRVNNTPITSNGGTITFTNTSGTVVYAETIGAVTLQSGLLNVVESTSQASTGTQTLTLGGLSQAASSTGSVAFSALGGLYTTKNIIVVTGATATTAGQIIGPWATIGTTAALQTDYAVYNGSAQVTTANITSVANDTTFTTTWAAGSNYNISASYSASSASGTPFNINTLRYSGASNGTITMTSGQTLGTFGILAGNAAITLTVGNTAGTGTVTLPTTSAGNLYVTNGASGGITINANITDNTGALTLVKNGSAGTLTLGGTNTYTGGTIINAGTVSVAALSGFGASGGITFNGSGTITATTTTTAFTNSRAITINNGALATYNIGNINGPTLSGAITGTGGLILQSSTATARTFTLSNTGNTFQGPLVIGGSSTSIITAAVASLADSASANGAIRLGNATQLGTFQWSTSATGALTLSNRQFDLAGTTGGGAIDNSNVTPANIITVNTDLSIQGVGAKTLTFQGNNAGNNTFAGKIYDGVGSVISLTKAGAGTWILSGTNTNTGAVSVTAGILGITGNSSGSTSAVTVTSSTSSTYKVSGASGKASTGGITVASGGVLTVDNTAVSGGPLANRLNSAVTLSGGQFNYNLGGSATAATDTITTLTVATGAGYSITAPSVTIAAATSGASSITVNSLARQAGGTLLISGPNLGTGVAGSGISNILVSANDASAEVIGGTGAAGSSTISINPFIIGQDTALSGNNQYGFMTDKVNGSILTNGLRSLVLATEYASTITSGASSTNNVNLSTLVAGLNSGTTVNSLRLDQAAGTFGTGTLTVTSGGILALGANRISGGTLAFGSNEAMIHAIGELTVDSAITGSGGLTKSGDSSLALSGSLSGLSGPVTVGAGRLVISSGSSVSITGALTIANRSGAVLDLTGVSAATFSSLASPTTALVPTGGQILLGSSGTLTVGDANNTNFVGIISGNGSFAKQGSGVLTLAGANVYSGSTSIAATGTLQGGVNSFLPKTTTVAVYGTLNLNDYTLTLAGISGSGVVTNTSATARAITLGNDIGVVDSTYSGVFNATTAANLTITKQGGGVFTLTNSGTAGTATGAWTLAAGTVKLDYSAAGSQVGNIIGAVAMTLSGGTLNVTGRDSSTVTQTLGNITLSAGGSKITLVDASTGVRATNLVLGTMTPTTAGSALLVTQPANTSVKFNSALSSAASIGHVVLTDGTNSLNAYNWLTNTGANTNSLATTYSAFAGTSTDTNNSQLGTTGTTSATTTLGSTYTTNSLYINPSADAQSLTLNAALTLTAGGLLYATGTNSYNYTIGGLSAIAAPTTGDLVIHQYSPGTLTISAPIGASVAATLTKAGPGTLVLGTLSISNANNIGGTTAAITITDGAKLKVTAALSTGTHTYSLTGGNATIEVATPLATDVMTINGVISGAGGLTKSGTGILSITATPTFTGPTFVTAGTLQAGVGTSAFGVATPVDVSSGAFLDINAQDQTIGSLSGAGTVTNSSSTVKTLTVGGANISSTFTGTFTGTTTLTNILTKVGAGTLTLSGSTSGWTGGTNVNGGVLRLGASGVLSTTGTMVIANAAGPSQLELSPTFTQTLAAITFGGTSAVASSSQGNVLIGSTATLTLGGTTTFTSTNNPLGAVISGSGSLSTGSAS